MSLLEEKILNKLQEKFGNNYKFVFGNAFDKTYTTPIETPNGILFDINYQAFESDNKIVSVFNLENAQYNVLNFLSLNTRYTIRFWHRIDNLKTDKYGVLIGEAPIDTLSDIDALRTTWNNTTIEFATDLFGKMTFGTPIISQTYDQSGTGKMETITITGLINLLDDNGVFASDTVVKLGVLSGSTIIYYAIDTFNTRKITNDRNGTSNQETGDLRATISDETNMNTITFSLNNGNYEDSPLLELFNKIAVGNADYDDLFTIPVQIYQNDTLVAEWNASIGVALNALGGSSGDEKIEVSLARKE